jgi:predicted HTH domain antitoxin
MALCSRGRLSRGKVAEILDLSFQESEDLFRQGRIPYPLKSGADDALDNASLPRVS